VRYYEIWTDRTRARLANRQGGGVCVRPEEHLGRDPFRRPRGPGAQGASPLGGHSRQDLAWQKALYDQGTATYVECCPCVRRRPSPSRGSYRGPTISCWRVTPRRSSGGRRRRWKDRATGSVPRTCSASSFVTQGEGAAVVGFDLEADVNGQPESRASSSTSTGFSCRRTRASRGPARCSRRPPTPDRVPSRGSRPTPSSMRSRSRG